MKKLINPLLIAFIVIGFFSASIHYRHARKYQDVEYSRLSGKNIPTVFLFLDSLESALYDQRIATMKPERAKRVFVATIDEKSLAAYGRWPWSRMVFKQILTELYGLGAEVVGFDAVFSESELREDVIDKSLREKAQGWDASLMEQAKLSEEQLGVLRRLLPYVGEAHFAEILGKTSTVLGYLWPDLSDCVLITEEEKNSGKTGFTAAEISNFFTSLGPQYFPNPNFPKFEDQSKLLFPARGCVVTNRGGLGAAAKHQGYFNSIPDRDGIYRRYSPLYGLNASVLSKAIPEDEKEFLSESLFKEANFLPSLSLRSVLTYLDEKDEGPENSSTRIETKLSRREGGEIQMDGFDIVRKNGERIFVPTHPDGSVSLKFFGSQNVQGGAYPIGEFSLAKPEIVHHPKFMEAYGLTDQDRPLKDSIVLIGPTAIGVFDLRPNPTDGTAAGVFLHATMVQRLLDYIDSKDLRDLSLREVSVVSSQIALWIAAIVLFLISMQFRGVTGIVLYLVYLACLFAVDWWLFRKQSMVLDGMTFALTFTAVYLTVTVYKYLTEERERAYIKNKFKSSVSPEIVEAMLKDPESMKGKKAELSVFFSDIRGFTTISESLSAVELAKFMNSYLSPMTDIVFKHGGTLDKYMGDAIMAIFGAPIYFPNHAERVVDCALDQMKRLAELKIEWKNAGQPASVLNMDIGIGVNTGEVSVGMMGSQTLSSYTVMGDNVNLASRLEGLNKEYGSHVIVSEFTYAQLPKDKYIMRRLDRVKVKGKNKPVEIYEVLALQSERPEAAAHFGEFEKALDLYFRGNFNEAVLFFQQHAENDPACELFLERCQIFVSQGAPANWDGAWTMTTK